MKRYDHREHINEHGLRGCDIVEDPQGRCYLVADADAEIAALRERAKRAEESVRILDAMEEARQEREKWPACGCMVDQITDVCMVHSPAVDKAHSERDAALARVAELERDLNIAKLNIQSMVKRADDTAERDPWRQAVDEAAVMHWSFDPKHTPREAVDWLLECVQRWALDPKISKEALALQREVPAPARAVIEAACLVEDIQIRLRGNWTGHDYNELLVAQNRYNNALAAFREWEKGGTRKMCACGADDYDATKHGACYACRNKPEWEKGEDDGK